MNGVCQQSQKPGSPGEMQRESQRTFKDHRKLLYSSTHQEPSSVLLRSCHLSA